MLSERLAENIGVHFELDANEEMSSTITHYQYIKLLEIFIDEALFAMLMSYDGKFNTLLAKEMLEEHFELK